MSRFRMLFPWLFEGVYTEVDGPRHLRALRNLQPKEDDAFEHGYLYSCLSILDSKAQALLTYVGILMAAASISLSIFSREVSTGSVLVFSALASSCIAAGLCLTVIWVHWTDTSDLERSDELFLTLLAIRNRRTIGYRIAWMVAQLATVLLLLGIVLERRVP
ncbi:hypothetical protein ABZW18_24275 [Streptomyces sp. NPDC004647]|uniref:hypothetical protein n=1 Tax=Streptomyces sp. NPDC004647 TaxID=3154671 RepID=UPI0033AC0A8E